MFYFDIRWVWSAHHTSRCK